MWNVKSERTKIRQFASLCTAHCQSGTTDNIVSLCCYFYVYTFLRHYKVQTKKDKSNYYLKFHKFTKKCFVIKHFNIQGRSQRGCKGGSLVPPDFSKNIEVKNGRYFAFANYGNTGCGVFKRGVQLERFLPKNQHTQRKLLNFENWVNGEASKIGHHFRK